MSTIELRELIRRLTRRCTRALEKAVDLSMKRAHFEVTSEHLILGLLDDEGSDFMLLIRHYQLDVARLRFVVERSLDDLRDGNAGKPTFAPTLRMWLEDASIEGAQKYSYPRIRSAMLFLLLVREPERYFAARFGGLLAPVPTAELARSLTRVASGSNEEVEAPPVKERPIVPETSAPTFRREPVAARPPEPPPEPTRAPPREDEEERPRAAVEPSRADLEARVRSLESSLARAEQHIVTLAEAQARADVVLKELTRTLTELLAGALDPKGEAKG